MPQVERDEFRYDQRDMRDNDRRSRENESRIDDARRELDRLERQVDPVERVMAVVNDPSITLDPKMVKIVNDPTMMMDRNGSVMKMLPSRSAPMQQSSFTNYPMLKPKRTRKKTKMDRTMSRCLKEANARGKLKNGKFRKGWDQSRIMTFAHKLCKRS
jgi:hypothetical protein